MVRKDFKLNRQLLVLIIIESALQEIQANNNAHDTDPDEQLLYTSDWN